MWAGKATVFAVGPAVVLALLFVVTSMMLGVGGKPYWGRYIQIGSITRLVGIDTGAGRTLAVEP